MKRLALLAVAMLPFPVAAQPARGTIAQLYSYRLLNAAKFREGYRKHLGWHARQGDTLVWYAWTVQAGPRRGFLIDGTAGASLAALDARPDLAGDGADFAQTAAAYAEPVDVETWELWSEPSTAQPLEQRKPGKMVDAFILDVRPGATMAFERALTALAQPRPGSPALLTWYRKLRGGGSASYMLLLARTNWKDVGVTGGTLGGTLSRAYRAEPDDIGSALTHVDSIVSETWAYEPRLSLMPGEPLVP